MRYTSVLTVVSAVTFLMFGAPNAQADGPSAVASLKQNMARARIALPFDINSVEASPSLVKGIYALQDRGTENFRAFINESGTIIGSGAGWQRIVPSFGDLNATEIAELRSELLMNVDTDKFIKVQYGDGGGRAMIMASAVDCVHCLKFENTARKAAASLNTTFYVFPLSLQDSETANGQLNWQTAANIWCAKNNASAWLQYWEKPAPITGQHCSLSGRQVANSWSNFNGLLKSVGIYVRGTPSIVREDGKVFTPSDVFDKAYAQQNFSRSTLAGLNFKHGNTPLYWLAAGESATSPGKKVSLDNVLKGLFSQ